MTAKLAEAKGNVLENNDRVRVTEYRFPPNSETGWHVHEYDYVVVPMTGGTLTIVNKDGTSDYPLTPGGAYYRQAGVEHNVTNVGTAEIVFIETEIKAHPLKK
jgi:mannose-6-phosphate isomerase-like protein (cupin superfamily)